MQYGKVYVPKRGDVILFQYGPDHVLFIKRIIGLPGDAVAAGPANKILVNDNAWQTPPVCGRSLSLPDNSSAVSFATRKVPTGQVFAIGDNLNNSLDSRIEQFEPVSLEKVVGKPVLIYWSPESARIGCSIR
jgi:signal peptidase I